MLTNTEEIRFSDRGTVLDVETDQYYDCTIDADYILSLPAMKGHRGGGVTFFAKNHFGTNNKSSASHMHKGLHKGTSDPLRGEYKEYRVFVDLMSYEHLGGKTLIYIGDFLWGTSMEHDPPVKFLSDPFNNDYSSSILVSLDPVAIASVCLDILQEEFQIFDESVYPPRNTYVRFSAVDDYLHQAASSDWWPEGLTYDPEGDGTPIGSLGVHEHWNNPTDRQYTRNLGTGEGIELIYKNTMQTPSSTGEKPGVEYGFKAYLSQGNSILNLVSDKAWQGKVSVKIYAVSGRLVQQHTLEYVDQGASASITLEDHTPGYYIVHVNDGEATMSSGIILP
jgi:hypothetical protein